MSDDLLRIARQMLAELEASEAYLRSMAIEALPYPKVMAMERRAGRRCSELLAGLGGTAFEFATVDDATDELLMGVVRASRTSATAVTSPPSSQPAKNVARKGIEPAPQNRPALAAAESVGAYEPFDDGPEGAADELNDLRSDEGPPRPGADADTADLAVAPPISSSPATPGFVTFESDTDDAPTITAQRSDLDLDADIAASRGSKRSGGRDRAPSDDFDNLVTFDDPVTATPATVVRTSSPAAKGSDLLTNALSGENQETFDLIPDLSEDDFAGFEDEEVTVVKTAESGWDPSKLADTPKGARTERSTVPPSSARKDQGDWASAVSKPAPQGASQGVSAKTPPKPLGTAPGPTPSPQKPKGLVSKPPVSAPAPRSPTPAPTQGTRPADPSARLADAKAVAPTRPPDPARGASAAVPTRAAQPPAPKPPETRVPPAPAAKGPTPAARGATPGPTPSATSKPAPTAAPTAAAGKPQPARAAVTSAPASVQSAKGASIPTKGATGNNAKATPQPAASAASSRVTAGLYGGGSVPTIRDSDEPRPRAAAIQLNASGQGARVLGMEEEEEPIEIGAADDDDDDIDLDGGGGFSVKLQQYDTDDDDDDDELELGEEDLEVIQPAQVIPLGPTPEEVRGMLQRAVNAAAAGDLQGGADLYSDVIDADPDNVMAHVARGRLFLDLGDYSRAMSDFMVGEDIAPNDPEPQVAIGDLYFARKDYRKAIDYFNAALEVSPNHAMAYCRRGISHYYRKNYKEAVDDLLKAERLDREIPNIQTYVSMARKKVKR